MPVSSSAVSGVENLLLFFELSICELLSINHLFNIWTKQKEITPFLRNEKTAATCRGFSVCLILMNTVLHLGKDLHDPFHDVIALRNTGIVLYHLLIHYGIKSVDR